MNQITFSDFLKKSKDELVHIEDFSKVKVVLGNESCDLDSAVASLVYGYYLHHKIGSEHHVSVLPVFNIPQNELHIKTEVKYFLVHCDIQLNHLTFKDQIDLKALNNRGKLDLVLVDHHTIATGMEDLNGAVTQVIDHHPPYSGIPWSSARVCLKPVGSCCTLIAQIILNDHSCVLSNQIATLLLGAILLDTACLSAVADRATPLDYSVADALQLRITTPFDRKQIFQQLVTAKQDISHLTPHQLLLKDLKVTNGIPIFCLPIHVQDFIKIPDSLTTLKTFCSANHYSVAVILGMRETDGTITRDLAIYSGIHSQRASKLADTLRRSEDPNLGLELLEQQTMSENSAIMLFNQTNARATRKLILPLITESTNR